MGWMMPFGGGLSALLWFAIIGLVVWGVVALSRRGSGGHSAGKRGALDIARERYARGEISREELEQIRRDLAQAP